MINNIKCLTKACDNLGITYHFIDKEKNLVGVELAGQTLYFQLNHTPFNQDAVTNICLDKMHTYELLSSVVKMPQTISFLSWDVQEEYKKYLTYQSGEEAVTHIEEVFDYPVVIKKNRGSLGIHVYLCSDKATALSSLESIFNPASKDYDYVALAQQFVPTQEEYRLVCAYSEPVLAYRRGNAASEFNHQYWEQGEEAVLIKDITLIDELYQFVKPVFSKFNIEFVGFDIIRATNGQLYLLELNSVPQFNHIIENHGIDCIVEVYEKTLQLHCAKHGISVAGLSYKK